MLALTCFAYSHIFARILVHARVLRTPPRESFLHSFYRGTDQQQTTAHSSGLISLGVCVCACVPSRGGVDHHLPQAAALREAAAKSAREAASLAEARTRAEAEASELREKSGAEGAEAAAASERLRREVAGRGHAFDSSLLSAGHLFWAHY